MQRIRVLAFRVLELDSWKAKPASSFDEVLDSPWLRELGGKVTGDHRHLTLQTYDDVFDVVCREFSFTLTGEAAPWGLRKSVLLTLQRALVGEVAREMQAIAVRISRREIDVLVFLDEDAPDEVLESFDGGAMTQVVAAFCWPEEGDPAVSYRCARVPAGGPIKVPRNYTVVFQLEDVEAEHEVLQNGAV